MAFVQPLPLTASRHHTAQLSARVHSAALRPRTPLRRASVASCDLTPVPRIGISFTCTVNDCNNRISKMIRKSSYEKGTVLIQCPSCKTKHVIADHLGWYTDRDEKEKDIESYAKANGQSVMRVDASKLDVEKLVESS